MTYETPKMPTFTTSKNGYEIRSDVLAMAKDLAQQDFQVKFAGWEMTAIKDATTGQIISTVNMPQFPGLEKILETAEKMYGFINQPTRGSK